jgi:hypothetical protein
LFALSPASQRLARGKAAMARLLAERGQTHEEFLTEIRQRLGL